MVHVPNRCHHTILKVKVIVAMKEMLSRIVGIKIKCESLVIGHPYCINLIFKYEGNVCNVTCVSIREREREKERVIV